MREKRRYLVFEVLSKKPVDGDYAYKALYEQARRLMGDAEMAEAGMKPLPKMWNHNAQRGMIRIQRKYVDRARAALCMLQKVGRHRVIMRSVGVSGMINKARERYLTED